MKKQLGNIGVTRVHTKKIANIIMNDISDESFIIIKEYITTYNVFEEGNEDMDEQVILNYLKYLRGEEQLDIQNEELYNDFLKLNTFIMQLYKKER